MAGTLYVVATPLGNLEDLSPRAAATLTRAAAVAAEDTRHTKPLLAHIASRAKLISFHAHSSDTALRRILHLLATGKDVALVTDAGTPTVSDPGALLVAAARARDIPVVTVPGPTAVAAALSVSGLGADRYLFLGFVPRKGAERRRLLDVVAKSEGTAVLFEAPPRVAGLLADLAAARGAEGPAARVRNAECGMRSRRRRFDPACPPIGSTIGRYIPHSAFRTPHSFFDSHHRSLAL